mgnify:CR=1 FL=1
MIKLIKKIKFSKKDDKMKNFGNINESLKYFKEKKIASSARSVFLEESKPIESINNYEKGDWWVQDFSSMLPLH